jgi:hypothetical protein
MAHSIAIAFDDHCIDRFLERGAGPSYSRADASQALEELVGDKQEKDLAHRPPFGFPSYARKRYLQITDDGFLVLVPKSAIPEWDRGKVAGKDYFAITYLTSGLLGQGHRPTMNTGHRKSRNRPRPSRYKSKTRMRNAEALDHLDRRREARKRAKARRRRGRPVDLGFSS